MTHLGLIIAAVASGAALGTLFFGGLWWTVGSALSTAIPAIWFALSALLRMAITVCGLYFFARLGLQNLIACLCGILAARSAVERFTRPAR